MRGRACLQFCLLIAATWAQACGSARVGQCRPGLVDEGACTFSALLRLSENSCDGFDRCDTYNVLFTLRSGRIVVVDQGVCLNAAEVLLAEAHYRSVSGTCRFEGESPCPPRVTSSFPRFVPRQ